MTGGSTRSGFTLIEAMLTVTIVAIGLTGIMGAYIMAMNAAEISQYTMDGLSLLKERLALIDQNIVEKKPIPIGTNGGEFTGDAKDYKWRSEVRNVDLGVEELQNKLYEVAVTVYNERVKPPRRFTITEYAANIEE